MDIKPVVTIYTDGACKGNPGLGGWGALLMCKGHSLEVFGGSGQETTTNNRMELKAIVEALRCLTKPCVVNLYTDSKYTIQGGSESLEVWESNGWLTTAKKPVKNQDLWKKLSSLAKVHQVKWHWVKGHSDDALNARADELANLGVGRRRAKKLRYEGGKLKKIVKFNVYN